MDLGNLITMRRETAYVFSSYNQLYASIFIIASIYWV